MTKAKGELVLITNAKFDRQAAKAPAAKSKKGRAPRPIKTYEVSYSMVGGEVVLYAFRLRTKELTYAQLAGNATLVGEVAENRGSWTEFGRGSLPAGKGDYMRFIREVKAD